MKSMVISTCSVLESTEGMQREEVTVMMVMELGEQTRCSFPESNSVAVYDEPGLGWKE